MRLREEIITEAHKYIERVPKSVILDGTDNLLKMIKATDSIEQQQDHLMSFLLASLFGGAVKKLVFEEPCSRHPSKGQHDLVAYLDNGIRIVNEILRLKQTSWDKNEQENYVSGSVTSTRELYELKEDPHRSTTGFLDTILNKVEAKSDQLDPNETNIIWIASKGIHYKATDIEDTASHYAFGWHNLPNDQPGKTHKRPENLSALGWFWDGDPNSTSAQAQCFFITPSRIVDKLNSVINVKRLFKI